MSAVRYLGLMQVEVRTLRRTGTARVAVLPIVAEALTVGQALQATAEGSTLQVEVEHIHAQEPNRVSVDVDLRLVGGAT